MASQNSATLAVQQSIDELIQAGTTFNIEALDRIYHDDLQVMMIDPTGSVNIADKATFKGLFEAKRAAGEPPLNTWAQYNHIHVDETTAHVLVTRKVNLTGQDQTLVLSIDLSHENDRWQVTREVIFVQPNG